MTRPQITTMTEFNTTRNSVVTEDINFDANLFTVGIPGLGADSSQVSVSLLGKRRITTLSGVYTGTEVQIESFRSELETEANKIAQPAKTYTTSTNGSFSVLINSFTMRRDLTSAEVVTWSIELVTSAQLLG